MSRRVRVAQKSAARARVARAKVLRRRTRATRAARAATAVTAAAVTLAGAGTAVATPHERSASVAGAASGADARRAACPTPRPSSAPRFAAAVGDTVFFTANDGVHGRELWKSDGTEAGTVLVKDIHPHRFSSGPEELTAFEDELFFTARDGTHGQELWRSNGTAEGTVLVKDIATGHAPRDPYTPASGDPRELTVLNGRLFFSADDRVHHRELWSLAGHEADPVLVKDINRRETESEYPGSAPSSLTAVGDRLFFSANDDIHGFELWKSDGSGAGTVLVRDIDARGSGYRGSSNPGDLTEKRGQLFFAARDDTHGRELWTSDGSRAGTVMVRNIDPATGGEYGPAGGYPSSLTSVGRRLFFSADDGRHGRELWKSDGSRAGTVLVRDIDPAPGGEYGRGSGYPYSLTTVGRRLFFSADDGRHGRELWTSTGSRAGTVLVKDINPSGDGTRGSYGYGTSSSLAVGGRLLFTANDGTHGRELWRSDGSRAGTVLVKDIRSCSGPGQSPELLTVVGGRLFFSADDGVHGRELWTSDGSRAGTVLVKDINPATTP